MIHVHSRLKFIPEKFNPWVLKIAQILLPIILRFRVRRWLIGGITQVEGINVAKLVELYEKFQAGQIRLLIAFRHPEVEDPLCILYLLSRLIPQTARQEKIALKFPIHTHFIYDRGMTIWAGNWLGWLFSRGGGIPIHRGRPLDRQALKNARDLMVNGKFPLTVAPEGATNGHGERVSLLEPGVAQLGFWCVEDLEKTKRQEMVLIVPIGIRYCYLSPPWQNLHKLLTQLEKDCGLSVGNFTLSQPLESLYPRLLKIGECLLDHLEDFYRHFYYKKIQSIPWNSHLDPHQIIAWRLQNLLDTALTVAEEYFGLKNQGTIIDRCRRLEEAGWNYIYREDIPDIKTISPLKKGLGNWVAQEADLRIKHMRLVESFVEVTGSYIQEKPTVERFAETTLIVFDTLERIKGTKMPKRPCLGKRKVQITIGEPIGVNERWPCYHQNRQAAKQAIQDLTQDLQKALENLVAQRLA